jgi:hypothetical protein
MDRDRGSKLSTLLALLAFAIALAGAAAARGEAFSIPCEPSALNTAVEAAGFNDEEDVIWLAPSCLYAINGILIAYADGGFGITIRGNGATISAQHERTAFLVNPGATLRLEDLTVTEGSAGVPPNGDGGAFYNAGALTLTRSTVSASRARTGGAVFNETGSSLTLIQSSVRENTATEDGGGIRNLRGRVSVIASSVAGNRAAGSSGVGAGIFNDDFASTPGRAVVSVWNSTFSGNASRFGAGIFNDEGLVQASHVTFSHNTMLGGGNGAAIYHRNYTGQGSFRLGNSILANGVAEFGGGFECVRDPSVPTKPITSTGVNLIEDASCVVAGAFNGDPKLGALTAEPAFHPLLPGSPVIDLADGAVCTGLDQRGASRPQDGNGDGVARCDLGAHEAP